MMMCFNYSRPGTIYGFCNNEPIDRTGEYSDEDGVKAINIDTGLEYYKEFGDSTKVNFRLPYGTYRFVLYYRDDSHDEAFTPNKIIDLYDYNKNIDLSATDDRNNNVDYILGIPPQAVKKISQPHLTFTLGGNIINLHVENELHEAPFRNIYFIWGNNGFEKTFSCNEKGEANVFVWTGHEYNISGTNRNNLEYGFNKTVKTSRKDLNIVLESNINGKNKLMGDLKVKVLENGIPVVNSRVVLISGGKIKHFNSITNEKEIAKIHAPIGCYLLLAGSGHCFGGGYACATIEREKPKTITIDYNTVPLEIITKNTDGSPAPKTKVAFDPTGFTSFFTDENGQALVEVSADKEDIEGYSVYSDIDICRYIHVIKPIKYTLIIQPKNNM